MAWVMTGAAERPIEVSTIRDVTLDGRGVADLPGKTVFVEAALRGERVRFQRRRKRKNFDDAALLEVLEPSPARVSPACEYFGVCGGCSLQHLAPDAQLQLKQTSLLEQLQRIGGLRPEGILEPLASEPFGYRRRARLGARFVVKKGRVLVGFREKHKPYVADMLSCKTLAPRLSDLIGPLSELLGRLSVARDIPQVELSLGDRALAIVIRVMSGPAERDLGLLRDFEAAADAAIWLQTGGPGSLRLLSPDRAAVELDYVLPDFDLCLGFGPLDFVQVNQAMNRRMVAQAVRLADPRPGDRVLDLFCGIGNFSLPLARHAEAVVGIELDSRMVERAQANAARNNLGNTAFFAADLSRTDAEPGWWGDGFDTVVLDPPRSGALEILPRVAAAGARRIVYVSCHPGSLARDASILHREYGYRLVAAGAMDMFPQTSHVEAMALFETGG